jgi:antitoxin component HigA of HigAB toxin-antitoxin module
MNSVLAEHENDYQRALAEIDKAIALDGREKQYKLSRERILQEMKAGK